MRIKHIPLVFELAAEEQEAFPSAETLANGIMDGLPKEWLAIYEDDDYSLDAIRWDTEQVEPLAHIERLKDEVANLREKNGNQVNQIKAYQKNVKRLIAQKEDQERVITNLYKRVDELQETYDGSLRDWETVRNQRDDLRKEVAGLLVDRKNVGRSVINALAAYGIDVGWGDDDELTALEDHAANLHGEANELIVKLDAIRTAR